MKSLVSTDILQDANFENLEHNSKGVIDFDVLESLIPELKYMHPDRDKTKRNFLKSPKYTNDRQELLATLDLWENILENEDDISKMMTSTLEMIDALNNCYKENFNLAITASKDLEVSYRTLASFFDNTSQKKIDNINILNADIEQLKDLDDATFIDTVRDEVIENFDRLDLSNNYSLLVIPGYLGSQKVIEKWAKIAHDNKVLLVTDFAHLDAPDDVVEFFETTNHVDADSYLSNTIMTCNWLVGRGKYDMFNETEDLYVPPSAALAGKIYSNKISQASAGTKFGIINNTQGVRFALKKNDLATLERLGLIPMYYENGNIVAYSAKTLFNGDNLGLQTYSVVRVFDHVSKALIDYFNRKTFENFNVRTRREFMEEIVRFLDDNTGADRWIESFSIKRLEQDPKDKNRVHLELRMEPYFPAKNFLIRMDGKIEGENNTWAAVYEQNT